jgi:hypothetical protein
VWRLLRDRLPTKANLVVRGILSPELHFYVTGCGGIETTHHLFLISVFSFKLTPVVVEPYALFGYRLIVFFLVVYPDFL